MKKFFILGLMAVSGLIVSCEEEEVPEFVNQDYLAGTWITKQIGTPQPFNNGSSIVTHIYYADVVTNAACQADNLMLNADMTFALNDYTNDAVCENEGISGTYVREDNRIIATYNDDMGVEQRLAMTIATLSYTELIVSYDVPGPTGLRFFKFEKVAE